MVRRKLEVALLIICLCVVSVMMPHNTAMAADNMTEHRYHTEEVIDGIAYLECAGCGNKITMPVMTRCYTLWNTSGTYETYMLGFIERPLVVGETLYYWIFCDEEDVNTDMNVLVTVSDVLSNTKTSNHTGYFTALKSGSTWISFSSKWNPDIVLSFRINVVEKTDSSTGTDKENDSQATISPKTKQKIKASIKTILDRVDNNSSSIVKIAVNYFRKIITDY